MCGGMVGNVEGLCLILILLIISALRVVTRRGVANHIVSSSNFTMSCTDIRCGKRGVTISDSKRNGFAVRGGPKLVLAIDTLDCGATAIGMSRGADFLRVGLGSSSRGLKRIIIGSGGKECGHGSGPTIRLVQHIVTTGGGDSLDGCSCCRCSGCRGVALTLGSVAGRRVRKGFFDGQRCLLSRMRLSPCGNGLALPMDVSRAISRRMCHGSPGDRGSVVGNRRDGNVKRIVRAKRVLGAAVGSIFASISVCSSCIQLLRCPFPSPLNEATVDFCRCCVRSAICIGHSLYCRLRFVPTGDRSFKFQNRLCILTSDALRIGGYGLCVPRGSTIG